MKLILPFLLIISSLVNAQINVYLTIEPPSSSYTCDGWVMAYVNNGQAPFTYTWNDSTVTNGDSFFPEYDTLSNLCPGVYTLDIVDSNNDSLHLDFFLTSTDLTFNGTGSATDTLDYTVENCILDYSIPIDSAYMSSVSILSNAFVSDADSIFVQWSVVQGTLTTVISDTLIGYFPLGSDFVLNTGIYCPDSTTRTQTEVVQIFGLVEGTLSTNTLIDDDVYYYPNPFTSTITILGLNDTRTITIIDLQGKVVYTKQSRSNTSVLELDYLTPGMYLLKISSPNSTFIDRIVKK